MVASMKYGSKHTVIPKKTHEIIHKNSMMSYGTTLLLLVQTCWTECPVFYQRRRIYIEYINASNVTD